MGNMKTMWMAVFQKQNHKNEMNNSKDIKGILNTSYSKAKNQTTTMIRKYL